MDQESGITSAHPFADDARRFFLFKRVRGDFHKMYMQMDTLAHLLRSSCPEYVGLMQTLKKHFEVLSRISDEDFDYYLRALAVERCIHIKSSQEEDIPEMLNKLLHGMMQLFMSDAEALKTLVDDALKTLHEKHRKRQFFESKQNKILRQSVEEAKHIYEQIEHDLTLAREGIVAKDKRMLELLQSLRIGISDTLLQAAVENANIRLPEKNVVFFTEALKRHAQEKKQKTAMQMRANDSGRGM
jgi:hypothetical protein